MTDRASRPGQRENGGNVICVEAGFPLDKTPAAPGPPWRSRYDARLPRQFQIGARCSYDAAMVLVDAMVRAG